MKTTATVTRSRGILRVRIELPTNAESVSLGVAFTAVVPLELRAWVVGSASPRVDFNIRHASARNAAGTALFASDQQITTVTTPQILLPPYAISSFPVNNVVWLTTSNIVGTVQEFFVAMRHSGLL